MAYIDQAKKAEIAPAVKRLMSRYGVRGSLSIRNHSSLVLKIRSGSIDFIQNWNSVCRDLPRPAGQFTPAKGHVSVNVYHYRKHFSGPALEFLNQVIAVMNAGNHDNSDIMTDYFDVGWYVNVEIGDWQTDYQLSA